MHWRLEAAAQTWEVNLIDLTSTAGGVMKRDSAKAPHSVLHTVFSGGKWARKSSMRSSSSSVRSRKARSASPTPSVASSRKSNNNNNNSVNDNKRRSARSQSPEGSLSLSQLASPSKGGSSSPFLSELKASLSPSRGQSPRSAPTSASPEGHIHRGLLHLFLGALFIGTEEQPAISFTGSARFFCGGGKAQKQTSRGF